MTLRDSFVECGVLPVYDWRPSCHIIAEVWPAWLSVVESLGLQCTSVSVSSLRHHSDWLPFGVDAVWSRSFAVEPFAVDHPTLLCLSGSLAFIEPFWTLYSSTHLLWVALDSPFAPSPSMSATGVWHQFVHADAGGVTTGSWWLGVSVEVPNFASPLSLSSPRRIGHCLSPTGSGPACAPPLPTDTDLLPSSFFPLTAPFAAFRCPSVFSATGWVSRPLSLLEVGRACDLPDVVAQAYASNWPALVRSTPFLSSAPQKLLHGVGLRCRQDLRGGFDRCACVQRSKPLGQPLSHIGPWQVEVLSNDINPTIFEPLLSRPTTQDEPVEGVWGRNKAAKADDAPVDTAQWDIQIWSKVDASHVTRALTFFQSWGFSPLVTLRRFCLRQWRRNLWLGLRQYMVGRYGPVWSRSTTGEGDVSLQVLELSGARECLSKAMAADWWDWLKGSRLFFWRWPEESKFWALQGLPVWLLRTPTPYRRPQQAEPNEMVQTQVVSKLDKFRGRGYIAPATVRGLINYFTVAKGDTDVRVVFDATKSGLNDCIWCPSFGLPTIETLLESLEPGSWQADIDLGEMFYNFMLDPAIVEYAGVDLSPFYGQRMSWEAWLRCVMGLKPSPYGCIRMELLHSELTVGSHRASGNPFYYDFVRLNLPGDPNYDPRLPRVSKVIEQSGRIAGAVNTYVDDKRCSGFSFDHCVAVTRRVASVATYLGIQDAPRKRVWPSQRAGAWTGSVAHTDQGKVTVLCTQEKWSKARTYVSEMETALEEGGIFNYKTLERQRGFMVYVIRTYPSLKPYLKGIHLTLDSWRSGRDDEGWKCANIMRQHMAEKADEEVLPELSKNHPETVRGVPRLASDLKGLRKLLSSETPPRRVVRSTKVIVVYYGFADASGGGFGSTVIGPTGIRYRYGVWSESIATHSSNYRELRNVVEAVSDQTQQFPQLDQMLSSVEQECDSGEWMGAEFYLFTDNAVAESAFYKGSSSNKALFELVLRLRQLELHHSLSLHVTHVSGRRMIAQGTDGLSRGDFSDGVMRGKAMGDFIPLHHSALDLSLGLVAWCQSWCPPQLAILSLTPNDWYVRGHGIMGGSINSENVWCPTTDTLLKDVLLWAPPPAAADAAVEQLGLSRHKRPNLAHIFVCPRLMTQLWRKRLYKVADVVFYLPAGRAPGVWHSSRFEPLVIGLCVPYSSSFPWCFRRCPRFLELESELRQVWKEAARDERVVLRKFWCAAGFTF